MGFNQTVFQKSFILSIFSQKLVSLHISHPEVSFSNTSQPQDLRSFKFPPGHFVLRIFRQQSERFFTIRFQIAPRSTRRFPAVPGRGQRGRNHQANIQKNERLRASTLENEKHHRRIRFCLCSFKDLCCNIGVVLREL